MAVPKVLPVHGFPNELFLKNRFAPARFLIAIDEVGRGCLAGPVVASVSIWDLHSKQKTKNQDYWIHHIKDSKKMTEKARERAFSLLVHDFKWLAQGAVKDLVSNAWAQKISLNPISSNPIHFDPEHSKEVQFPKETLPQCMAVFIGAATPQEIDSLNIWGATQVAMGRALWEAGLQLKKLDSSFSSQSIILVDGKQPIKVPKSFELVPQVCCVGGDAHFVSIGFSSVVAKVIRDRYMMAIDEEYPEYSFSAHKGYGTKAHRDALSVHKNSDMHRKSFLKPQFIRT